ncbi:MAG: hypothetical protein IT483_09885 [Gammaproteobacteria bacterium]|nr:hypothetical protein [Gammaproteobacteria bacterium]
MFMDVMLVAHIAVLGYWLGAEFVINSTYRYVSWSSGMPFFERNRLMEHVMKVDQHVRYALVLQVGLGTALAALRGYLPGGTTAAMLAGLVAAAWLILIELVHRLRHTSAGDRLDAMDRGAWTVAGVAFLASALAGAAGLLTLPAWLSWKLGMFAGVFFAGMGIRVSLMSYFRTWQEIATQGSSDALEARVRRGYVEATLVLGCLWLFIAAIVVLSIWKPL